MTTRLALYHPYNPKNRKDGGEFAVCAEAWVEGFGKDLRGGAK